MSNWVKINFKLIFKFIGASLMILGAFMIVPAIVAFITDNNDLIPILISAFITFLIGLLLRIINKSAVENITNNKEAYLIVVLGWLSISAFAALPYLLSGLINNFTSAIFESVSGLTTTGATVLSDIESVSKGIVFWRSQTQWLGGMGFIMLIIMLVPKLGSTNLKVITSDILNTVSDKPAQTLKKSIRWLWSTYSVLTLIVAIVFKLLGMSYFDAVCHAFSSISTGGFSTHNDNIIFFSSHIQLVIIIIMIIAGANYPLLIRSIKSKPLSLFKSQEFKYYLFLIFLTSMIIALILFFVQKYSIEEAIMQAVFQVSSIISTTGYVVADYTLWLPPILTILLLLMLTGSCSGSAGGGIKVMRQLIMLKNTSNSIRNIVNPSAIYTVKIDKKNISEDVIYNVLAFYFIYLISFASGAFLLSLFGIDFQASIGIAASAIGNIGINVGYSGPFPFYYDLPTAGKWIVSALMIIGRLEIFSVFIVFSSSFWKN